MGNFNSTREIISVKEATERVPSAERKRLHRAYKRLCPYNTIVGVGADTFRRELLAGFPYIPRTLSDRLFAALDRQSRGTLSFDDLLCAYAIFNLGSAEEIMTILFFTYDYGKKGYLDRRDIIDASKIFSKDNAVPGECLLRTAAYEKLFEVSDTIKLPAFLVWVQMREVGNTVFVWWLIDVSKSIFENMVVAADDVSGEEVDAGTLNTTESTDVNNTKDQLVLVWLRERYASLDKEHHGHVDQVAIGKVFSPPLPAKLLNIVFFFVDKDNTGLVEPGLFVTTIARLFTGTLAFQLEFLFEIFDRDEDHALSSQELTSLLRCMAEIEDEFEAQMYEAGLQSDNRRKFRLALAASALGTAKGLASRYNQHSVSELISETVKRNVPSKSGKMSLARWKEWSMQNINLFLFSEHSVRHAMEFARRRLSPREEREAVKKLLNTQQFNTNSIREGQTWYIVSKTWWSHWDSYTNAASKEKQMSYDANKASMDTVSIINLQQDAVFGIDRPGKIDQSEILDPESNKRLRTDISRNSHYVIVSPDIWKLLQSWYGGGPAVPRKVVKEVSRLELEMYPIGLRVCRVGENHERLTHFVEIVTSRFYTVSRVKQIGCQELGMQSKHVRLWDCRFEDASRFVVLPPTADVDSRTVEEMGFIDGQEIQLEQRELSGLWPNFVDDKVQTYRPPLSTPGLAGLQNLGNTCYMNASLQGLMNVPALADYFCKHYHIADLNPTAALGSKDAELACAFTLLSEQLVGPRATSYPFQPRMFKKVLERFNEMFVGYDQHDSQEFLAVLLDGIHEDINRVKKKPYLELPDSNDRPDKIVAKEWWDNHLSREDSVVQKLFAGQFKSSVECATCGYESARFEPFTMLQVQLPSSSSCTVKLHVVFEGNCRAPLLCGVRMNRSGTALDLKRALEEDTPRLGRWPGVSTLLAEDMILVCIAESNIYGNAVADQTSVLQLVGLRNLYCLQVQPTIHSSKLIGGPLRLGDRVKVWQRGYREVPATIALVYPNDESKYDIKYADGEVGKEISTNDITRLPDKVVLSILIHRRPIRKKFFFVHDSTTQLFGVPFLLRFVNERTQARNLYVMVWKHTRCMFRMTERGQNMTASTVPPLDEFDVSNSEEGNEIVDAVKSAWGFSLHFVGKNGIACSKCPWYKKCTGCLLEPLAVPLPTIASGASVSIDWSADSLARMKQDTTLLQFSVHESIHKCMAQDDKKLSIYECMNKFISQEKLSGNDQVYCSKCKEHRDHRKQVTLFRPPPVLIVHLKRFKYTNRHGQKIGRMVTCPLQGFDLSFAQPRQRREPIPVDLTMWEFLGGKYKDTPPRTIEESRGSIYSSGRPDHFPDPLYDCVAVVNHYGSFGGGHYVACAKNPVDHKWRLFDDAYVKVVDGASVISENAYIMFYVRRDMANVKVENLHSCASATEEQMKEYNKLLSTVQGAKNSALGKCFIS